MQERPWHDDTSMKLGMSVEQIEAYQPRPPSTFTEIMIRQRLVLHGDKRTWYKDMPECIPRLMEVCSLQSTGSCTSDQPELAARAMLVDSVGRANLRVALGAIGRAVSQSADLGFRADRLPGASMSHK